MTMADEKKAGAFTVFSIKAAKDGASTWVKAGSAYVNRDGSINVYLDVLPLDGKLHLRRNEPEVEALVVDDTKKG